MIIRKIYYSMKALFMRQSTWALLCSIIFLLLVINNIHFPQNDNINVGIITNDSISAKKCVENLNSIYNFTIYKEEAEMKGDILSGILECGFAFSEDFDSAYSKNKLKDSIKYYYSPYTNKGTVIKETIYSALLKEYSNNILLSNYKDILNGIIEEDSSAKVKNYITERNAYYLMSNDIFMVDFEQDFN